MQAQKGQRQRAYRRDCWGHAVQCIHAWPSSHGRKRREPLRQCSFCRLDWTRLCPNATLLTTLDRQQQHVEDEEEQKIPRVRCCRCLLALTPCLSSARHKPPPLSPRKTPSFRAPPLPHSTAQSQPQNTDTKPCRARLHSGCWLSPPSWRKLPWPLCLSLPLCPPPPLPARPLLPACTSAM